MSTEKHHEQHEHKEKEAGVFSKTSVSTLTYFFVGAITLMVIVNQLQINSAASALASAGVSPSAGANLQGSGSNNSSGLAGGLQLSDILPTGVPAIYGSELGIRYDDVSASNQAKANETISKMAAYENQITLSGDKLQRYIATLSQISCEYCCGAQSIIFDNGEPACGCAHSGAMRGLAKYLLDKHADEITNDQLLEELGKWKALFFPGNMLTKANALKAKGIEMNYINMGSNKYRGIEKSA